MHYIVTYILLVLITTIYGLFPYSPIAIPTLFGIGESFALIHIPIAYLFIKFAIIDRINTVDKMNYFLKNKIKIIIIITIFNITYVALYSFLVKTSFDYFFIICQLGMLLILKPKIQRNKEYSEKEIKNYFNKDNTSKKK